MKMKALSWCILMVLQLIIAPHVMQGKEYHSFMKETSKIYEWDHETSEPFDELIVSWNARRPERGYYALSVRVFFEERWSPWLLYATWGVDSQKTYCSSLEGFPVSVDQDLFLIGEGHKASRFQVRVEAKEGASLSHFVALHAFITDRSSLKQAPCTKVKESLYLPVRGISQMAINSIYYNRICSPTSTTAVIRYLQQDNSLDPLQFAYQVRDQENDIFGNWVLNTAQAFHELQGRWFVWAERLENFDRVYESLKAGAPVVISVRGPLPGSACDYTDGHLMAIIGYDAEKKEVLCMDPAFLGREASCARYALNDLLTAWARRGNIAYLFSSS